MAEQRAFGNQDKSSAVGTQDRNRGQEAGTQDRNRGQEASAQGRDSAQGMVRQGEEAAAEYAQQGREQVAALEPPLEDARRAKPWQSVLLAAGIGMFLMLLWKK